MHPESCTKDVSNSLVAGKPDGTFLVRKRAENPGDYVLVVVYKKKPTHHLMTKANGVYTVNKKDYGAGATTVSVLVDHLSKPGVQGWCVFVF